MSGRTCSSPSPALTPRPARQPSTPGWAVAERCGATRASRKARLATVVHMLPRSRHRTPKKESRRSGHGPRARPLWQQARGGYPDDVWIYVQAGIEYGDIGHHAEALEWLTTGLELALRTGDPDAALEQLRPLRASCRSALGHQPDDIQERAAQREHM